MPKCKRPECDLPANPVWNDCCSPRCAELDTAHHRGMRDAYDRCTRIARRRMEKTKHLSPMAQQVAIDMLAEIETAAKGE